MAPGVPDAVNAVHTRRPDVPNRHKSRIPALTGYPKPYRFIGFGDSYGPKPYGFIGFGDSYGPKTYKFIGFGDSYGLP